MTTGTPNQAIHPAKTAAAQAATEVLANGKASGQQVQWSITVNSWV
jgi:hypothetical protein